MRIGIDARFYGSVGKGLGRYTQKLIENLERIDNRNSYFIFLRKENWNEYRPRNKNFNKVLADVPWYSLKEQIFMPRILKKYQLDLVHFPHFNIPLFYKGKFVITIHDLILFHFPTKRASTLSRFFYFVKLLGYRLVIRKAVKKSRAIITVSKYTKEDIIENFKIDPDKIIITYEAVDILTQGAADSRERILGKYGIIKPYLLYVGNAYPHKNLERLLLAFKEVLKKHSHLYLVMVGGEDYFYARLKKFVRENKIDGVIFAGYVAEEHLPTVYREAVLYVFPSLYEGFGLPPLEAMARNIPVASSSSSCLPEVLGDAVYYFDPEGISEIAGAIEEVAVNNELRRKLIQAGQARVRRYSWRKLAEKTLKVYESH